MASYSVAIFTSAFLVFQVQPIIARHILPWFGGTPSVWTACMLFFQVGLLLGYLYAHWLARSFSLRQQVIIHVTFLAASLVMLPITPEISAISEELPQSLQILALLGQSVGLPFLLLSASAPLLQQWFAHAHQGKSPFRLYALSNLGSLLALLTYPFLIEPNLRLHSQSLSWSTGYLVFLGTALWCGWPLLKRQSGIGLVSGATSENSGKPAAPPTSITGVQRLGWIALSASGSAILLAITNQMCQDVAVIPFLWVVPLSLYLISFIICFERDAWYFRGVWIPVLILGIILVVYLMRQAYAESEISLAYQIAIYCFALFGCCMVCHGEMVRRKPDPQHLTEFYVFVAFGGALGGLFVSLIAPLLFNGYWELHLLLIVISGLTIIYLASDKTVRKAARGATVAIGCTGLGILTWQLYLHHVEQLDSSIADKRGFYGVLHVYDEKPDSKGHYRALYHGRISHGEQWLHHSRRNIPTAYYGARSGVGLAIMRHPNRRSFDASERALNVGVVGLGVGTLAVYGKNNDRFHFYEINPQVESLARTHFSYLKDSQANVSVSIGDGRKLMQEELKNSGARQYDILVVDAFSGDAIPIHLMTKEASDIYWQHLKDDGILAFHITNFHLDLSDVVRQLAAHANKQAIYMSFQEGPEDYFDNSNDWVLITSNEVFIKDRYIQRFQDEWHHDLKPILWSDDFSNLFDVVYW